MRRADTVLDIMSSTFLSPSYLGSWSRFVGCGTNGGTETLLVLNADGSGTFQQNKRKGAASGNDENGQQLSGVWRNENGEDGPVVMFKPDRDDGHVDVAIWVSEARLRVNED